MCKCQDCQTGIRPTCLSAETIVLDPFQEVVAELEAHGPIARQMRRQQPQSTVKPADQQIGPTAWNNRLSALASQLVGAATAQFQ